MAEFNKYRPVPIRTGNNVAGNNAYASAGVTSANKVLRNTYLLLSMTLLFAAAMAGVSMAVNAPYGLSLICSLVSMGLLWFVVPRVANSSAGIYTVFAVTGLLGFGLGPILNMYVRQLANGSQVVMMALGATGAIFLGLSAYAVKSRRDFSFMRGFLAAGLMLAFFAGIGVMIAAAFGLQVQPFSLAVSAAFALLSSGVILYQTGEIINGGETNYVLATVTLFVSIYNLFLSLLQLLGFASRDD